MNVMALQRPSDNSLNGLYTTYRTPPRGATTAVMLRRSAADAQQQTLSSSLGNPSLNRRTTGRRTYAEKLSYEEKHLTGVLYPL